MDKQPKKTFYHNTKMSFKYHITFLVPNLYKGIRLISKPIQIDVLYADQIFASDFYTDT